MRRVELAGLGPAEMTILRDIYIYKYIYIYIDNIRVASGELSGV